MQLHQVYFIIALLLIGGEIVVPGFVLAPIGIAAFISACVAYFIDNILIHTLVFCISAGLIFLLLSKFKNSKWAKSPAQQRTGLVGQVGTLTELCRSPLSPGKVRVFADDWELLWEDTEAWHAKVTSLELGTRLQIIKVVGNKVCVELHQSH